MDQLKLGLNEAITENARKIIACNIRRRRAEMNLTQPQLGSLIGIKRVESARQAIWRAESGDKLVTMDMLLRIATALRCSVRDLLEGC